MTRFLTRAAAALCLAGIALSAPSFAQQAGQAPATQPDSVLKETHGAWEVHCVEGTENCFMQQFGETADGERAMLIVVQRLAGATANGENVPATMTAMVPLGVLIPVNVQAKVGEGETIVLPLVRCLSDRCVAQTPLREENVQAFKQGANIKFGFVLSEEVLVDISLNGFTAAYDSLEPVQMEPPAQN